ncbi:hypothetical protein Baya_9640 [Bagarius yarrelli]|uniref:Uncharacterized protein n=1 Tax=Bagarius yarrelli TaxID=175774 RepID=A0A556UXS1_BAGYA|nr:hypothetical protein Baya_9640 [Bagarius yarrelli]
MVTSLEKRWKARPGGGAERRDPNRLDQQIEDEEGLESGDCDDEDECAGVSGLGPPTRRKRLRIFAAHYTSCRTMLLHTRWFLRLFTGRVSVYKRWIELHSCLNGSGCTVRRCQNDKSGFQARDLADNLAMDDLTFHELLLTPRLSTDTHGGASLPGAADGLHVSALVLFPLVVLLLFGFQ